MPVRDTDQCVFRFSLTCQHCLVPEYSQGNLRLHMDENPTCRPYLVLCGCCNNLFTHPAKLAKHLNRPRAVHRSPCPPGLILSLDSLGWPLAASSLSCSPPTHSGRDHSAPPVRSPSSVSLSSPPRSCLASPTSPSVSSPGRSGLDLGAIVRQTLGSFGQLPSPVPPLSGAAYLLTTSVSSPSGTSNSPALASGAADVMLSSATLPGTSFLPSVSDSFSDLDFTGYTQEDATAIVDTLILFRLSQNSLLTWRTLAPHLFRPPLPRLLLSLCRPQPLLRPPRRLFQLFLRRPRPLLRPCSFLRSLGPRGRRLFLRSPTSLRRLFLSLTLLRIVLVLALRPLTTPMTVVVVVVIATVTLFLRLPPLLQFHLLLLLAPFLRLVSFPLALCSLTFCSGPPSPSSMSPAPCLLTCPLTSGISTVTCELFLLVLPFCSQMRPRPHCLISSSVSSPFLSTLPTSVPPPAPHLSLLPLRHLRPPLNFFYFYFLIFLFPRLSFYFPLLAACTSFSLVVLF